MVAENMLRTYGVDQVFRFIKGIWLNQKIVKSVFWGKRPIFYFKRAQQF